MEREQSSPPTPENTPAAKINRDEAEGVTPQMREARKRGLLTTPAEFLQDLEVRAEETLPETMPEPETSPAVPPTSETADVQTLKAELARLKERSVSLTEKDHFLAGSIQELVREHYNLRLDPLQAREADSLSESIANLCERLAQTQLADRVRLGERLVALQETHLAMLSDILETLKRQIKPQ